MTTALRACHGLCTLAAFLSILAMGGLAPVRLSAADPDPLSKPVLTPAMLSYLGCFHLPSNANGWSTAWSQGGLALRHVNGRLQFFSTSHAYSGGLVYEFNDPGESTAAPYPQASVVTNWGDIYTGQKTDDGDGTLGAGCLTYGLSWDEAAHGLYWSYGDWYNTTAPFNPSIGFSVLDDARGIGSGVGAWSMQNRPEHLGRGGTLRIPDWFAQRFTHGWTLGIGFGGYYSIIGSGSLGPALAAIPDPTLATYPDDSALPNVPMLGFQPAGGTGFGQRTPDYRNREPVGPYTGTVVSATSTTLVTANLLKASSGFNDWVVAIAAGTGAGQSRDVSGWDYPSQTLTLTQPWVTIPADDSTFLLYGGTARGGTTTTIQLKATATQTNYAGMYLTLDAGTGAPSLEQQITAYDPTTQTATVSPGWSTIPDATSRYECYHSGFGPSVPDPHSGVGSWTWCDYIGGAAWIDTPDCQGILVASKWGTGHVYYEASNIWSDGQELALQVYNPQDLARVAQGQADESSLAPASTWIEPTLPQSGGYAPSPGGVAFDATTNRVYVLVENVWQDGLEWKPAIYVYQVAGAVAGATAGSGGGTGSGGTTSSMGSDTAGATGGGSGSHCGLGGGAGILAVLACVGLVRRRVRSRGRG